MRQYIGARYVPTYYQNSLDPTSSEWEANVQYDPLTIVSLPNLHSYQSKKFVPANIGSPASNPEYWYDQGYANAYFQALQDQIDDMNDGTVPGSLQAQIDDNTSDITALANLSTPRRYQHVVCIGDSWGGSDGWPDKLQAMGFSGDTFQKETHGGTGFQTGSPTFAQAITNMTPTVDANLVDCVIIIGGTNDQLNLSTLPTAIGNTVTAAKTKFPNAKVYVGFNLSFNVGFGQTDATERDGSVAVIANGGIPLAGLSFNQRYCKADWLSDGWHLTDYSYFAKMIYSGIYCGTIDVPRITQAVNLNVSTSVVRSATATYANGYCYLTVTFNPGQTFNVLDSITGMADVPLFNLYGRSFKTIKSSTSGDTLDIVLGEGSIETYLGGTIGSAYPVPIIIISHHGTIIN